MTEAAASTSRQQLSTGLTLALTAVILLVGFGDGIAYRIRDMTGVASPWLFLFPLLIGALLLYWTFGGRSLQPGYLLGAVLCAGFMMIGLMLHLFLHGEVYIVGYLQLTLFVVMLIVVQGVFADAPQWLAGAFPRALAFAHYFLCGYVLLAFASWHLLGSDLSIPHLMVPQAPDLDIGGLIESRPFRPSGFSVEPAWAAMALAASYTGLHCLMPAERDRAFLALAVAAVALQSPTLILFAGVVAVVYTARGRESFARAGIVVLAAVAMVFLVYSARERLVDIFTGVDPSALMRLSSTSVAWQVIEHSFPLGVGYGNFRHFAEYGPGWNHYINLAEAQYYKSDSLFLNYAAELGIWGVALLLSIFWNFTRGTHLLPAVFVVVLLALSGTLLMPSVLVMAAIVGLLQRRDAMTAAVRLPQVRFSPPAPRWAGARAVADERAGVSSVVARVC
jgi:hypothetical protein